MTTRATGSPRKHPMRSALLAVAPVIVAAACSGVATGSATVTGTLEGSDGACLYVLVPRGDATDRYWLRHLPSGYEADEHGLRGPSGSLTPMGGSLTVSGALSWDPFDRHCAGEHTLDVTEIE